jgi:hypothetical protein
MPRKNELVHVLQRLVAAPVGLARVVVREQTLADKSVLMRQRRVAAVQAVFYVSTGVWPLVHRRSFERVTGPKVDFWLVETVGAMVAAIGLGLAQAVVRGRPIPRELRTVAVASAVGLAAIDAVYVGRRRIASVYLADAVAEIAVVVGWLRSS